MGHWRLLSAAVALLVCPTPLFAACQIGQIAELKVTMSDMKPLVSATINGHDVQFVADSGAFYSDLSPGSAAELKLPLSPAPLGLRVSGIGGDADASVTTVKSLGIGGVSIPHVQFLVSGSEVGAIGLLGQNLLGIADVEYDLEDGMIRLMKSTDCAKANLAYWSKDKPVSVIDIESRDLSRFHTIGTVMLDGKPIKAMFDYRPPILRSYRSPLLRA